MDFVIQLPSLFFEGPANKRKKGNAAVSIWKQFII